MLIELVKLEFGAVRKQMTSMEEVIKGVQEDVKGVQKNQMRFDRMLGALYEFDVQQKRGLAAGGILVNTLHIADCLVPSDGAKRLSQVVARARALSWALTKVGMSP
jgi:hypothetical protein